MKYLAALRTMPATRLPLACAAALLLYLLYPPLRAKAPLMWSFVGAAGLLVVWHVVVVTRAIRTGRRLGFDIVIRRAHYMQPFFQGSIYAYWGWYYPEVYPYVPFIAAQLLFLYAFDALLAWTRRDRYGLGFGPFPIVFSTNLFLWFLPDWFFFQFALIATGSLGKEFIRWERDGKSTHIFNPSAFSLALFSVLLIVTGSTHLTNGIEIARTEQAPPYIYHWLFAVSLVASTFFRVTLLTVSAASSLVLISAVYTAINGTYLFIDTSVPAAVFLGMILLMTDPSTTPRSDLGKVIFGAIYGASAFALYLALDAVGVPTFYDKLLAVPPLNLAVQAIDRFASRARWRDLGLSWAPARRNALHIARWFPIFGVMLATGAVGKDHEGRNPAFWRKACEDNLPRGCTTLVTLHSGRCTDNDAWSCNELGIALTEGRGTGVDTVAAARMFDRACQLGFAPGCANATAVNAGSRTVSREAASAGDLALAMRNVTPAPAAGGVPAMPGGMPAPMPGAPPGPGPGGASPPLDRAAFSAIFNGCQAGKGPACVQLAGIYMQLGEHERAAATLLKGCDARDAMACANLAFLHRRGMGLPADPAKARALFERACSMGLREACAEVNGK